MKKFFLSGLAEGLVGRSSVMANSVDSVFQQFPALQTVRSKLTVKGSKISGFSPCDG